MVNCKFPSTTQQQQRSPRRGGGGGRLLLGRFQDRRIVAKADHMIRFIRIVARISHAVEGGDVVVSILLPPLEHFFTSLKGSAWPAEAVANALPI